MGPSALSLVSLQEESRTHRGTPHEDTEKMAVSKSRTEELGESPAKVLSPSVPLCDTGTSLKRIRGRSDRWGSESLVHSEGGGG